LSEKFEITCADRDVASGVEETDRPTWDFGGRPAPVKGPKANRRTRGKTGKCRPYDLLVVNERDFFAVVL
jgi:hypothetical protein